MIGFGELRRRSLEWQVDIGVVERAYATDWLLKGIFDHAFLSAVWVLRASSALRWAYGLDDAPDLAPEFLVSPEALQATAEVLTPVLSAAAEGSRGLRFALVAVRRGMVRIEYTGPLGRRSATQPHILLTLISGTPRLSPVSRPLYHPFSDACPATVSALSLDEIVADRIAGLAQPRVRDVYDLWQVMTRLKDQVDLEHVRALTAGGVPTAGGAPIDAAHRAALERSWDRALRHIPRRPAFAQVERELAEALSGKQ